jgi:penicillin-insensitive murein endopeptidase
MPSCVPQQDPPGDDGCGKDLDTWLALVSEPPKPPSAQAKGKPAKPPLTLADLPKACSTVLSEGQPVLPAAVTQSGTNVVLRQPAQPQQAAGTEP